MEPEHRPRWRLTKARARLPSGRSRRARTGEARHHEHPIRSASGGAERLNHQVAHGHLLTLPDSQSSQIVIIEMPEREQRLLASSRLGIV